MKRLFFYTSTCVLSAFMVLGCSGNTEKLGVELRGDTTPTIGVVEQVTLDMKMENCVLTLDAKGQQLEGIGNFTGYQRFESEYVSEDKVRVLYHSDKEIMRMEIGGISQSETTDGVLNGLPVIGTLTNGEWTFVLESSEEPSPEQREKLKELAEESSGEGELYPLHRVQVGDSWALEKDSMKKFLGSNATNLQGSGIMEFREQLNFEGHPCAHLFFDLEIEGDIPSKTGSGRHMKMALQGEIYRSLDTYEDLYVNASGEMGMGETLSKNGMSMQMSMSGPIVITARQQ